MDASEAVKATCDMPNPRYSGLWDCIVVDPSIKDRLLRAALLGIRLREDLPFEVTAIHGLALLYGPPGTGKTTLARGLAHQISNHTKTRRSRLIEVDPHGLMSAEHGQSQRKVTELLTEYLPTLAEDGIASIVLLDEVESMAVARSEASLAANPADVHRATDAVLSAIDATAASVPNLFFVATSNFTRALDSAFLSRVDVAIHVPAPDAEGVESILRATLTGLSAKFPQLSLLARHPQLHEVANLLAGTDGRRVRKAVTEAMLGRLETVIDPGELTLDDLLNSVQRVRLETRSAQLTGA
jgi:SpoVK/Ycf46/Vps4 family AAA+-type ATPase